MKFSLEDQNGLSGRHISKGTIRVITKETLIREYARQIVDGRYSNSHMVMVGQALHDVFYGQFALFRWRRLSHESRCIGREAVRVHHRKVDGCVLTRIGKYDNGK